MNDGRKIKVGDQLFVVWGNDRRKTFDTVTIVKVGRKYAYFEQWRQLVDVDMDSLAVRRSTCGYVAGGQAWLSEADYNAAELRKFVIGRFQGVVHNYKFPRTEGLTAEKILAAAEILGIPADQILPPPKGQV